MSSRRRHPEVVNKRGLRQSAVSELGFRVLWVVPGGPSSSSNWWHLDLRVRRGGRLKRKVHESLTHVDSLLKSAFQNGHMIPISIDR